MHLVKAAACSGVALCHLQHLRQLCCFMLQVMPDWKTVYITDDFTNGILAMFVASKAGDLSCGTLYAAKFVQTSADGEGPDAPGGAPLFMSHCVCVR